MIVASIEDSHNERNRDGLLAIVHPNRHMVALPSRVSPSRALPNKASMLHNDASLEGISLLRALEHWEHYHPALLKIDEALRDGRWQTPISVADVKLLAPLPRTWAFLDGSAFVQHVLLVRKARGVEPPHDLHTVPLMYQGASDNLLPGSADIPLIDLAHGMDFESEVAIITDHVPMGTKASDAARYIRFLVLLNDVSLRELIPREVATGFGFLQGKPPSSFAPFAITPDELGDAWRDGRVHLRLETKLNGKLFGQPNAQEMHFSFFDLIEHASKTRPLSAGTIIGSGTVSNTDESAGSGCLVEQRMLEKIHTGTITTAYLQDGDRVRITMRQGTCELFGTIDQRVSRVSS